MISTDGEDRARRLAGALFDEVVAPLAAARKAGGSQAYFPMAGEQGAKSYYVTPTVRVMQPADFEFPGGGTAEGLVDALAEWWTAEGEIALASMAPSLKEIAETLQEQVVESDGSVSIFCYTMF
ncbi:MAG: hypothetical protein WD468_01900 [Pirellulales bacterium]